MLFSELSQRLLSTAIALPLAVVLLRSTPGKLLLLLLVVARSSFEFHRCVLKRQHWVSLYTLLSVVPALSAYALGGLPALCGAASLCVLLVLVLTVVERRAGPVSVEAVHEVSLGILGLVYIGVLLGHAVLVHELACDWGTSTLAWVITCTLLGDNGGYLMGKLVGKTKVTPAISPNKSLEGFIGAIGLSVLASVGFCALFKEMGHPIVLRSPLATAEFIVLGVLIGVVGIFGDLFESFVKRAFGVKDMASLFPGWGGVLDRVDALIFTFPAVYYYFVLVRGHPTTFPGCSSSALL